ncbi:MAG: rane protein [Polaromonas sp.]|nr:rane protein [Polaromonas sp.]
MNHQAAADQRVLAIDALRGYAMLGVAVVNAHAFNHGFNTGNYAWDLALTLPDRAAELISNLGFAHRSISLLAFLLGVGLVVQSRSLERNQVSAALSRRYLVLLAIGVVHGLLLWPGDILAAYAVMVLVLGRFAVAWSPGRLKSAIGALVLFSFGMTLYWALTIPYVLQCQVTASSAEVSFAQSNWLAGRRYAVSEFLWSGLIGQLLNANIWALVLLGVWCGRAQAFWQHLRNPSFRQPLVLASLALLAVSTTAEWLTGRAGGWSTSSCFGSVISLFHLAETTTTFVSVPVLLTLFAWLAQRRPGAPAVKVLEAVGRAPLTMFFGQSVAFTLVFSHAFMGLHGQVGRLGVLATAVLTYALLAVWIERRYRRRGVSAPLERLWRWFSSPHRQAG